MDFKHLFSKFRRDFLYKAAFFMIGLPGLLASQPPSSSLTEKIKPFIQESLNLSSDFNLILDNSQALLSFDAEAIIIKNLQFLSNGQRFTAQLCKNEENPLTPAKLITGQIQLLMPVPVLTRPISLTEEIQESDITWKKFPLSRLNSTHLTLISDLIGRIPSSQILQPGQPLSRFEVKSPVLIKRGALVNITYKTSTLSLSRQAEAQQDGTYGESIRFLVPETKKTIRATVLTKEEAELKL